MINKFSRTLLNVCMKCFEDYEGLLNSSNTIMISFLLKNLSKFNPCNIFG